jgi:hypothetical protein
LELLSMSRQDVQDSNLARSGHACQVFFSR